MCAKVLNTHQIEGKSLFNIDLEFAKSIKFHIDHAVTGNPKRWQEIKDELKAEGEWCELDCECESCL